MKKAYLIGVLYFIIHFILEVSCFYTLSNFTDNTQYFIIALLYDLFAFVPQGLFGAISDKYRKFHFGQIGVCLIIFSLFCLKYNFPIILIFVLLTIGNCIIHVEGAESTLRTSKGKMFPSALFVAGGAFGIITGRLLFKYGISITFILMLNVISLLLMIILAKYKDIEDKELTDYNYDNKNVGFTTIVLLATFVVAVRSFTSYGIPTGWNKTVLQSILLFSFMGIGKALGGLLIDKTNIKFTSVLSCLLSLPFLLFGDHNMYLSLIGIMLFSMTMPVTLAIIVSRLKKSPGIAFGFTTIGLFIGSLPAFFFTIDSIWINAIVFTILTILCTIILYKIEE